MDLLIDTHVFIWWEQNAAQLPPAIVDALSDSRTRVFVSAVSIWEIATKRRSGKLVFEGLLTEAIEAGGFTELPIAARDAERAGNLDWEHRDPFDRIIVAQCLNHKLTLVTADRIIRLRDDIPQLWARR